MFQSGHGAVAFFTARPLCLAPAALTAGESKRSRTVDINALAPKTIRLDLLATETKLREGVPAFLNHRRRAPNGLRQSDAGPPAVAGGNPPTPVLIGYLEEPHAVEDCPEWQRRAGLGRSNLTAHSCAS